MFKAGAAASRPCFVSGIVGASLTDTPFTGFAVTHPGLESVLILELTRLGLVPGEPVAGGGEFSASFEQIVLANLSLRTASRVLVRVATFRARSFIELERHAKRVEWGRFLGRGVAAHFRVTSKKSKLFHEKGIAERLASAVLAKCQGIEIATSRATADLEERDVTIPITVQRFVVRFHYDECTISADSSGPLLHRRGYRQASGKAPLRETLAAGLLLGSGWDGSTPLIDPMCGSGTIPIEAALIARRMAPGLKRQFAFEQWPEVDPTLVTKIRSEVASVSLDTSPVMVIGSDRDAGAVAASTDNAALAGVADDVEWRLGAVSTMTPPPTRGWIVTNPPYGARVGDRTKLRDLYAQFGNVLRRVCPGWQVAMISADRILEGHVGLRWREIAATDNGGIPVRFIAAEVPEG